VLILTIILTLTLTLILTLTLLITLTIPKSLTVILTLNYYNVFTIAPIVKYTLYSPVAVCRTWEKHYYIEKV